MTFRHPIGGVTGLVLLCVCTCALRATDSATAPTDTNETWEAALMADVDECRRLDRLKHGYVDYLRRVSPMRLPAWRRAEENGQPAGLWMMAHCYLWGVGGEQDPPACVDRFQRAALQDFAPAMHKLGILCREGWGVPQDLPLAAEWFRAAANMGYTEGMHDLACLYDDGGGVPKDEKAAVALWGQAANAGNELATNALGIHYWHDSEVDYDLVMAADLFERAANAGQVNAIANLARMYIDGEGRLSDEAKALEWVRRAFGLLLVRDTPAVEEPAELQLRKLNVALFDGHEKLFDVACWYHYYSGRSHHDYQMARVWYQRAVDRGSSRSMLMLAHLNQHGQGAPKNPAAAVFWYRKSAEAGDPYGMAEWARTLFQGDLGVERDLNASAMWYERSVEAGFAGAMCDLGGMYARGEGVPRDPKRAAELLTRAAHAGYPRAMMPLAWYYCTGQGVEPNYAWARLWVTRAKPYGGPAGLDDVDRAVARMGATPMQRKLRRLVPAVGALAVLLGFARLSNIRRRRQAELRQREQAVLARLTDVIPRPIG